MRNNIIDFHSIIINSNNVNDMLYFANSIAKSKLCSDIGDNTKEISSLKVNIPNYCDLCNSCHLIDKGSSLNYMVIDNGEGENIKIADIIDVQKFLSLGFSNKIRIVFINRAENMTVRAQNRMLKILEEPFPNTKIILGVSNMDLILDTVASRCVVINAQEDSVLKDFKQGEKFLDILISGEPFYVATEMIDEVNDYSALFCSIEKLLRDKYTEFQDKKNIYSLLNLVIMANKGIKLGLNPKYVLKKLCLEATILYKRGVV